MLTKTDAVAMQREDLALSPAEVRVRYEMRNDTGQPVTLRVAFPMPEVPKATPAGMDTSTGHNIGLDPPTKPNFLAFRVWADGQEVKPEVEVRATLPDGREVTEELRQIGGLKLVLQPRVFELPFEAAKRTGPNGGWDLDAAARARLKALGAITEDKDGYDTQWTTHVTFHWMQTFKPGVTVIEHSYKPVIGSELFASERPGDSGKIDAAHGVWKGSADEDLARAFCIDPGTDRAMRPLYARLLREKKSEGYLSGYTLAYILRTANNWHGPIGTFHLTLSGGHVNTGYEDAGAVKLMTLCTDLPLRQTGPMRFEATVADYAPNQDLRVFMLTE